MDEVVQIIETIKNTQDFFQKAKHLQHLHSQKKVTIKRLSDELGIQPAYICHIIRLNRLPEIVADGYYSKLVSVSHLFIIARLKTEEHMIEVYEKVLSGSLTALQTEGLVREYLYKIKNEGTHIPKEDIHEFREMVKQLDENIRIDLIQTRVRARLTIEVQGNLKTTSEILTEVMKKMVE